MGKTCILYGRVSSRIQAETFSLPTQFRKLRAWADCEGYTVVEEVDDRGGKDSKRDVFDRPGVERIFDLCESRHVDVVLAQERSCFGEYPIPEMIAYRLAEHGSRLKTPSDSEGEARELMQLFTDWTSRRERRTTARRSRSRKLEQARCGYVVPGHTPPYGFRVAGERTRRVYVVEERHMEVVRAIFEMVGVRDRGERLRSLEQLSYVLGVRANTWNRVMDVYPDELRQAIGDSPWEYDPFAKAEREQLQNSTPEERRVHYESLELRVVALSKDELEVSGVFGRETLYKCSPSPRPRDTTTP